MRAELERIEEAQKWAQRLVFRGVEYGEPLWRSRAVVIYFLKEAAKLPLPKDVLAFASGGQVS